MMISVAPYLAPEYHVHLLLANLVSLKSSCLRAPERPRMDRFVGKMALSTLSRESKIETSD